MEFVFLMASLWSIGERARVRLALEVEQRKTSNGAALSGQAVGAWGGSGGLGQLGAGFGLSFLVSIQQKWAAKFCTFLK